MIHVLIVEDSALAAEILTGILQRDPDIQVVGVARNGVEAVEMTPLLKPDLITMDVWMPQMDGFATVEQIMAYHPTPILVITTSLARPDVDISLTMLAAGALDVMEKPSRLDEATWEQQSRALIRKVKLLARVRVVTHLRGRRSGRTTPAPPLPLPRTAPNGDSTHTVEVPLGYSLRTAIGNPETAAAGPAPGDTAVSRCRSTTGALPPRRSPYPRTCPPNRASIATGCWPSPPRPAAPRPCWPCCGACPPGFPCRLWSSSISPPGSPRGWPTGWLGNVAAPWPAPPMAISRSPARCCWPPMRGT